MTCAEGSCHADITDVPGIRVGQVSDAGRRTGVTVILPPPEGACAGVFIGGNAPSTRQMDSLKPRHLVNRVHGVCLCGGSAFGLDAAGGVLAYLARTGAGFHVVDRVIPIAPAAAIFDLSFSDGTVRPDPSMGAEACLRASSDPVEQGSVGAGTGASVGKLFGIGHAMKGGVGSASVTSGELVVGALVVVNAYGDITDGTGNLIAGARRSPESLELVDSARLLKEGRAMSRAMPIENTTLAVVAVNAKLDKVSASRVAAQATMGLTRVIRPFHSHIDGDLTIVLSLGHQEVDHNRIGLLAADVLERSVIRAVLQADGFGVLPACKDLQALSVP